MNFQRNILLLLVIFLNLTSCRITNSARTTQIEIMKPGIFNIPKDLTVAIINRDLLQSDTCTFYYSNGYLTRQDTITNFYDLYEKLKEPKTKQLSIYEMIMDTTIKYRNLSETSLNALVNHFEKEGYFRKVINYGDSLNDRFKEPGSIVTQDELFEYTQSDVCIFLDYIYLNTTFNKYFSPPFKTKANLLWTVTFKTDSLAYSYKLTDTLFYDKAQVNSFSKPMNKILEQLLSNSCEYLGSSFGTKVIPSWVPVQRMYYRSYNRNLLTAEKLALQNDWIKAAEIWNRESKNKKSRIAAKACFNMALACEMEGKPTVGIEWLVKSYSALSKTNKDHQANCQRYVNILATRKKEIERLANQVEN